MAESSDVTVPFSPFDTIVHDGMSRIFNFIKHDAFTFVVNGEEFTSTLPEAIALSPLIYDNLQSNSMNFSFHFPKGAIDSTAFRDFLDFVRSRASLRVPRERVLSFISISGHLGNEPLSLALLSAMNSGRRSGVQSRAIPFEGVTVDECASAFHLCSVDQIRSLDRQTLHRVLSSRSLSIESEDWLLRLLLDLGVERSEFFSCVELEFLTRDGLALFVDNMEFDDLTEGIWLKVGAFLKGLRSGLDTRHFQGSLDSAVVRCVPAVLREFSQKKWTLLYRGSRDGFQAAQFHRKCDNQANTVTLIETTKGYQFGGFTPVVWDSSNTAKADNSQKSFIFTLKNPRGSDGRKFALAEPSKAIYCGAGYGPIFGVNDIYVYDNCASNNSSFGRVEIAYANDTEIAAREIFVDGCNFTVKEIEVFSIAV
jgi:hypothetical protein